MARFDTSGLGELALSLEELANLPDDVAKEMLTAGGEVIKRYQRAELEAQGLVAKGTLRDSIRLFLKWNGKDRYALVYPYGEHGQYNRRLQVKPYIRSKHGRTYTVGGDVKKVTNNDVGFVWEFGAPNRGFAAREWMRLANEKGMNEAVGAEAEVYQRWMEKLGL